MIKPIVISDPYPRTLDLIFTKTKLKELKTKYKIIVASFSCIILLVKNPRTSSQRLPCVPLFSAYLQADRFA